MAAVNTLGKLPQEGIAKCNACTVVADGVPVNEIIVALNKNFISSFNNTRSAAPKDTSISLS
jgi:hypothetical protein